MSADLELRDEELGAAAEEFMAAASTLRERIAVPLGTITGLTDIGSRVTEFVRGLDVARRTLGADEYALCESVGRVMSEGSAVDAELSGAFGASAETKGYM